MHFGLGAVRVTDTVLVCHFIRCLMNYLSNFALQLKGSREGRGGRRQYGCAARMGFHIRLHSVGRGGSGDFAKRG